MLSVSPYHKLLWGVKLSDRGGLIDVKQHAACDTPELHPRKKRVQLTPHHFSVAWRRFPYKFPWRFCIRAEVASIRDP
jgi:hypothetical protein